jgi:RNA polymerase sigma-70 factor, ECF subfamily
LALYMKHPDGTHRAFQLQVLTLTDRGVSHVGCFFDTALFAQFGLPEAIGPDKAPIGAPKSGA